MAIFSAKYFSIGIVGMAIGAKYEHNAVSYQ